MKKTRQADDSDNPLLVLRLRLKPSYIDDELSAIFERSINRQLG